MVASKCFISYTTNYVILDDSQDIRGSASTIDGITEIRKLYGWGTIHTCIYSVGRGLTIDYENPII